MTQVPETSQLLVDRRPKGEELLLRPNTLTLLRQVQALQALQNAPLPSHRPLLRLTESTEHARWPSFEPAGIEDGGWMVLTDETRPGTDEQRRSVEIALATPDRPGTVVLPEGERIFNPSRETRRILEQAKAIGGDAERLCQLMFSVEGRVGQRKLWGSPTFRPWSAGRASLHSTPKH